MIKNREKILHEKMQKIYDQIKVYLEEMDSLSDTKDFTIDNIEKMWSQLDEHTKQIYREINEEVIRQVDEKSIIKSKKRNIHKKE